jgi:hypothetical protein
MKVRRGEVVESPGRIPVLSVAHVLLDDHGELRVLKEIADQTVQS